jgi:methylated-DNA-[protein]-cysteine S-methyltransferase
MQRDFDAVLQTPIGLVGIRTAGDVVTEIVLGVRAHAATTPSNGLAKQAVAWIQGFFDNPFRAPDVPLATAATPFQRRVRTALQAIPPGQTRTYGDLARELGTSPRAIGAACRANPCPILVPCHRVVATGGGLGGFSGHRNGVWLDVKRRLLAREGLSE